jgi:FkbM family methyltransferase
MPATKSQRRRAFVRLNTPWRRIFGDRTVRRNVQGVQLYLPWAHALPDYARLRPTYGQNLVRLAEALDRHGDSTGKPMSVLDIGANVGDSAAQIMSHTSARVLCVEGDPYWVRYLRMNLGSDPRATIEESLLVPTEGQWASATAVRSHTGTTHFSSEKDNDDAMPRVSVRELRDMHPDFDGLRLVKSDTDGFDPSLVPAVAETWKDVGPVLFFEFDPGLAKSVVPSDPHLVWEQLAALGYEHVAVWDNTGDPLGRLSIAEAAGNSPSLEPRPVHLGYDFWDVAVVRADDSAGIAALDDIMREPFSVSGTSNKASLKDPR